MLFKVWTQFWHSRNFDTEVLLLFLQILWVDGDKNWYGLPLVNEQVHSEKDWKAIALDNKKQVLWYSNQDPQNFFEKSQLSWAKNQHEINQEIYCRLI